MPDLSPDRLLTIQASSMMAIATFAVATMVSAHAWATARRRRRARGICAAYRRGCPAMRLQKAFQSLAQLPHEPAREAANRHARMVLECSRLALPLPQDFETLRGPVDARRQG